MTAQLSADVQCKPITADTTPMSMPPLDEQVLNAFRQDLLERLRLIETSAREGHTDNIAQQAHMLAGSAAYCNAADIEKHARAIMRQCVQPESNNGNSVDGGLPNLGSINRDVDALREAVARYLTASAG